MKRISFGFSAVRSLGLVLPAAWALSGCSSLECGAGTFEMDGACVAADEIAASCGPFTVFNATTGRCENQLNDSTHGECGPNTEAQVDDAGKVTCVGTGGGTDGDCSQPISCPASATGVTLCGKIYNLGDSSPIGTMEAPFTDATLSVDSFDPLQYIAGDKTSLAHGMVDGCGRFRIDDSPIPAVQLVAIGFDDLTADVYIPSGIVVLGQAGKVTDIVGWMIPAGLDAGWKTSAGDPFSGQTFAARGAYMPIFVDSSMPAVGPFAGTPATGVAVLANGAGVPTKDYYFSDTDPLSHLALSPSDATTGASGAAFVVDEPDLRSFSGSRAGDGCSWPTTSAATVPGVVVIDVKSQPCAP